VCDFDIEAIRKEWEPKEFTWEKTWTAWPRKDCITGKRLPMFSEAYRGYQIIRGPYEDLLIEKWVSRETFMFEGVRGNL